MISYCLWSILPIFAKIKEFFKLVIKSAYFDTLAETCLPLAVKLP